LSYGRVPVGLARFWVAGQCQEAEERAKPSELSVQGCTTAGLNLVTRPICSIRAKSASRDHTDARRSAATAPISRSMTPKRWPASPARSIH